MQVIAQTMLKVLWHVAGDRCPSIESAVCPALVSAHFIDFMNVAVYSLPDWCGASLFCLSG